MQINKLYFSKIKKKKEQQLIRWGGKKEESAYICICDNILANLEKLKRERKRKKKS